jgi:hypothetical protein
MAYQFDAYGTSYQAGFPGTMLQINSGDLLKLHLTNDLAVGHDPSDSVFLRDQLPLPRIAYTRQVPGR